MEQLRLLAGSMGIELACEKCGGKNWNGVGDGCGDGCGSAVEAVSSGLVLDSWDSAHSRRVRNQGMTEL